MGSEHGHGRPTRAQQRQALRRRRALAGAAVLVCIAADVWSVTTAGAREPTAASRLVAASRAAVAAGTGPAILLDPVERVPGAGTDSQVSERLAAASPPSSARAPSTGTGVTKAPTVVESGTGTFAVVPVPAPGQKVARATGRPVSYTVELEGGLGVSAAEVAAKVSSVLLDPRGWQTRDHVRFVDVSPAQAAAGGHVDLRITLASPDTTDKLCAPLETRGEVSCHNGGRVVLNARRWLLGATAYGSDLDGYRTYLVNHEVGHGIGHAHAYCGGQGKPAPVMMQQTYGLRGCTSWPWPVPPKTV
ncbi:DUF3152 domain-containing protein [Monashia sp. NPDC004114]